MSLVLKDVRKSYREPDGSSLPILDIPQFSLQSGEQSALLGPSGGGKTTLLNVIAGITTPDSGTVTIDGVEITRLHEVGRDRFRAQKIGFVFQTFNLLPAFTALENVLLGMSFSGKKVDRRRAVRYSTRTGLFRIGSTIARPACRWANNSGSPWRDRLPIGRRCYWLTSRLPTSM